jgi:hypothetical protein
VPYLQKSFMQQVGAADTPKSEKRRIHAFLSYEISFFRTFPRISELSSPTPFNDQLLSWRPHGDSKIAAFDNTTGSLTVLLCFDE